MKGWQLILLLGGSSLGWFTGGPMHDLSMWLGLLTTLKMDFDRDLPIRDIP